MPDKRKPGDSEEEKKFNERTFRWDSNEEQLARKDVNFQFCAQHGKYFPAGEGCPDCS